MVAAAHRTAAPVTSTVLGVRLREEVERMLSEELAALAAGQGTERCPAVPRSSHGDLPAGLILVHTASERFARR